MKEIRQILKATIRPGIKVHDPRTAKGQLARCTGISPMWYDVCKGNCFCFAADPEGTECPYCLLPWKNEKGLVLT